jgi:hypothetical protein
MEWTFQKPTKTKAFWMGRKANDPLNVELTAVLEGMLLSDEDITARAVVRLHTTINNPSDFTRNVERRTLLELYQAKQADIRRLSNRVRGSGAALTAHGIHSLEERVTVLEDNEDARIASHLAMITAVCELGGTAKLRKFYESYAEIRDQLARQDALPASLLNGAAPATRGSAIENKAKAVKPRTPLKAVD